MDNPGRILTTLDGHLDHFVRLVLYGRSAICLGFEGAAADTAQTKDVDCIISLSHETTLHADSGFWDALESTNKDLAPLGLYMTHLFSASEVFLRTNWEEHLVPVNRPALRHLQLFRPATIDLVLTKCMRGNDPQDMADARFMIEHDRITRVELTAAFQTMQPIELVELRDTLRRAKPVVLGFAHY